MPVYPFREWLPDQGVHRNPGLVKATNLWPIANGYEPVRELQAVTSALTARPRGAINVRDADGNVYQYAGDAGKLYRNVDNTWTDSSIMGGYSVGNSEAWEFLHWKNKVIAVSFGENPQAVTLGGTTFANLTTALKAHHITKIRDFVVVGNTTDSTDGHVAYRVRWCAFNDETDWTVDPATQADYQDLRVGVVERIFGGEYGVVLQSNSVWRMTYTGNDTVFDFDEVQPGIGLIAPGAAAQDGDVIYFLSRRGLMKLSNGTSLDMIGANKIDATLLADLDENYLHRISAVADPRSHRFLMAYPGAGNVEGRPNRVLVYDRTLDRFTLLEDEIELLWRSGGLGFTLEGLDSISGSLDDLGISLDSPAWVGGAADLAAFDHNFKSGYFDGDAPMTARIQPGEVEFHEGHYTHVNAFRSMVEGGSVRARVGVRDDLENAISWGGWLSKRPRSGLFKPQRGHRKARYHSFEYEISGDWTHALGQQIERGQAVRGGRYG